MIRRSGAAAVLLLLFLAPPIRAQARFRTFEIEAAFSGWTLAPFHPLLEGRTEDAVREAFRNGLGSTILGSILSPLQASAEFGASKGSSFSATVWMRLGRSRFSLGLRADVFAFHLPFTMDARETVAILGIPLAEIDGRSVGTVRIRGLGGSLLGRWLAVEAGRFELALGAGLALFPYEGTIDQDIQAVVRTPLGDATLSGPYDMTIEEARGWSGRIPKAVLSPSVSVSARYRFSASAGLSATLTASQGMFMAGGLFFVF